MMLLGQKRSAMLIVIILVVTSIPVLQIPITNGDLSAPSALSNHNEISITNDSQFNTTNGMVSGNGSEGNPYIIENWSIDVKNYHGINIENTQAHFIIRNCHIYNSTSSINIGIYFNNVTNGSIVDCRVTVYMGGIHIYNSMRNLIHNNSVYKINNLNNRNIKGIEIKDSELNTINRNEVRYNGIGIGLISSDNNTIKNNLALNNINRGIYLYESNENTCLHNRINNNSDIGMEIARCNKNKLFNNTFFNNTFNFGISGRYGHFVHNITTNNSINGKPIIYWIGQSNKIIPKTAGFIGVVDCDRITVRGLAISNNYQGILIARSQNCIIENNTFFENRYNIDIVYSDTTTIKFNTIYNGSMGILIDISETSNIHNNSIFGNNDGVYGSESENNLVHCNHIINNLRGIAYWLGASYNLNYNNYFSNTVNHAGVSQWNAWNISKTLGKNIIGGRYLGGNYWSDYTGSDQDGDGIGNTPFVLNSYSIDHYPLTYDTVAPDINDHTLQPTTGDLFMFNATVQDQYGVESVYVNYWFEPQMSGNNTMNLTSGDEFKGIYTANITVPDSASDIFYFFNSSDMNGNCITTETYSNDVTDNDAPVIVDNSSKNASTWDIFTFKISVTDNIELAYVFVEYWVEDNFHENITLTRNGDHYCSDIIIPSKAVTFNYIISAVDNSTNWAALKRTTISIIDNDSPLIFDLSGTPNTGEFFQFKFEVLDNIAVSLVFLDYWFDDGDSIMIVLPENLTYSIPIQTNATILYALVTAVDVAGNIEQLELVKPITNAEVPLLLDMTESDPGTGTMFLVRCKIAENWLMIIKEVTLEYRFDTNAPTQIYMILNDELYEYYLNVPLNATKLDYTIRAEDNEGNFIRSARTLQVRDVTRPGITDSIVGSAVTGQQIEIVAAATDNFCIRSFNLEYWFDNGTHINKTFDSSSIINIPMNAQILHYKLIAVDIFGNIGTKTRMLAVIDDQRPIIDDSSLQTPTTGDIFEFNISISDNVKIVRSYLEYWFYGQEHWNISNTSNIIVGHFDLSHSIIIPANATTLYYQVFLMDGNKNSNFINRKMNVIDNVLNTQVFFGGYVIDNNDPLMLGRVRIVPENDNKEDIENAIKDFDTNSSFPDVNGPWSPKDPLLFLPLLPVFINPVPKIGEYVNLFYQYRGKRTSKNKFYIQGPLSTPVNLKSDDKEKGKTHLDAGSRLPRPQNIKVNLSTEASKELFDSVQRSKSFLGGNNDGKKSLGYTNDKTKGVYPEPGDNSLLGRGSADIVIKENETIIRAGKYKNFNPPNMPDADGRRAFLQLSKFDFTKTKGTKKSRKRLNKQDKFLKYLIEYNIYNPENLQNNFRGDITLYKLPSQVAQTNTANFDVDTVLSSNLTVSSYILNFNNKTIDEVISLVNNFIVDFKDGVLTDTFIPNSPLSPGEQFPFYFRPKNSLLNFINNFDVNNDPNTTKNVGFILSSIKINDFDITPGF